LLKLFSKAWNDKRLLLLSAALFLEN